MDQNQTTWAVIKCPYCGHQYVPAEIMMPIDFIGKPNTVLRDALGKIIYQDYIEDYEPSQKETYICDSCNHQFIVEPVVTYKVRKEAEELDFQETSVSLLK